MEGGSYSGLSVNGAALIWDPVLIKGNMVCMKYFWNVTVWNGFSETHKRKHSIN